MTVTGFSKFY